VRVLLIDDDRDDSLITQSLFEDFPHGKYDFEWVGSYEAGLEAIRAGQHDVYLLDYRLGARNGIDLLAEARGYNPDATAILLTGQGEYEIDRKAIEAGASDYIEKSRLDSVLLERSIRHTLLQKKFETELARKVRERTAELETLNRRLEREIAVRTRAEEALREADRRKDEFLATLAHELRNPLAPIRNAISIMKMSHANPDAQGRARDMMERQVTQMVQLIDELLDVSRITRGKLQLEKDRIALGDVVRGALEVSQSLIQNARLNLVQNHPDEPVFVYGDRLRLSQVLTNLLNNAAKYTEPGGTVTLETGIEQGEAVLRVGDTGVGIAAEHLPRVFELFTQIDRTLNRSQGGLGIGLALVSRIVAMHNGRVEAASEGPGRGATFTVYLPLG
jgi:signal transduction histidine kinase